MKEVFLSSFILVHGIVHLAHQMDREMANLVHLLRVDSLVERSELLLQIIGHYEVGAAMESDMRT